MEDYKTGHRERLRSRAENSGIDSLRSFEILELLLCYAVPRVDMSEAARLLIKRFGSIGNVLSATPDELTQVPGIGRSAAEWLAVTGELVEAYAAIDPSDHINIDRHKDATQYVTSFSKEISSPLSMVVFTDFSKRVIMKSVICDSISWAHPQHVRRIITEAISLQARNAILVLFSGSTYPDFDEQDTEDLLNLARSLQAIDVEFLDCIIFSESGIKSLNALGAMDMIRNESKRRYIHEDYCSE